MACRNSLIVVTEEPMLARKVAEISGAEDSIESCDVCRGIEDLMSALDRDQARAVLVDIDAQPEQILDDLDPITSRFGDTRFIIVATEQNPEWMLKAMQAGARHFLVKGSIENDLAAVLKRLVPNTVTSNGSYGSIMTILSAGGGCGATTIALNLANELSMFSDDRFIGSRSPALLLDLDCHYGGAAGVLGVHAQYGIGDVLADGDRVDAHLIRSTAVPYHDQLHVLASPATVNLAAPAPDFKHIARALQKMKEAYLHTVVDAPRVPLDVAAILGRASVMTYIVLELNVEDIRVTRQLYTSLIERGVQPERIRPLVSRYRGRKSAISINDARKAIGAPQVDHISNDFTSAVACINYGKLLSEQAPRSALRKELQDMATVVRQRSAVKKESSEAVRA